MASHKINRVESDITRVIGEAILSESRDKILKNITITGASVSKDLGYAKIYFTSILDMEHEKIEKEVNEASGFLRTEIANKLNLRHTPKLTFVYDNSIEYGNRIEKIIKEMHENE